jgi:argininosuccinate lyase
MGDKREKKLRTRFQKRLDAVAGEFIASIPFDRRLYRQDIAGSIAHVQMLAKQKVISQGNADLITSGLSSILKEIEQGKFKFTTDHEDIHMAIESRLFEMIGDVAGELHTARSRNDQIALDMRLFIKEAIVKTVSSLKNFQQALLDIAETNISVIMPGYTHLQQAQPVLFSHYLLAYFEMLQRDVEKFQDCLKHADVLPLGSGALAGVPYPVDRDFVARELGFSKVSTNSLDAVSDRDFMVEYEASAAITMMHLSRLAEEIVLWSSQEFNFIEIDDAYATTSSIMPQKKNADVAELIRGKTGRVFGSLVGLLTVMKGLPLAYNRDMQEDKELLFDTVDTLLSCLDVFAGLVKTMNINAERMYSAAIGNFNIATDLADYLTKKGLPFRQAHGIVGSLVQYAISQGKSFKELDIEEYRNLSPLFADDVYNITVETSIADRDAIGGTAPQQVAAALAGAKKVVRSESAGGKE